MKNKIPRRVRLDLYTPAEVAIYNAMQEVEKMPADMRLTEAVVLLGEAKNLVADLVDESLLMGNDQSSGPDDNKNESELQRLKEENLKYRKDIEEAAGELIIQVPMPGTDLAKVVHANTILRLRLKATTKDAKDSEEWAVLQYRIKKLQQKLAKSEQEVQGSDTTEGASSTTAG